MSMTLTDAKAYVVRPYATTGNTAELTAAADSLKATAMAWSKKHLWSWLIQDTTQTFTVVCSVNGDPTPSAVMTTVVTNGFANVLKGMTVTGAGIAAATTVLSVESDLSLTLSASIATDITSVTMTFGGTIPIIAGTASYKLPVRFWRPRSARLLTNPRPLTYMNKQLYDRIVWDQSGQAVPSHYSITRNGVDFNASGTQQDYITVFRTPQANDVLLFTYFRAIDGGAATVDVPDEYLYDFLDAARIHYLFSKNSADSRLPGMIADLKPRLWDAIYQDKIQGGEDEDERIIPQIEHQGQPSTDEINLWGYQA